MLDDDKDGGRADGCNDNCPADVTRRSRGNGTSERPGPDGCPNDDTKDVLGICGRGVEGADSDSDGTADCRDNCHQNADKTAVDQCGCGVAGTDGDSDGTPDSTTSARRSGQDSDRCMRLRRGAGAGPVLLRYPRHRYGWRQHAGLRRWLP